VILPKLHTTKFNGANLIIVGKKTEELGFHILTNTNTPGYTLICSSASHLSRNHYAN